MGDLIIKMDGEIFNKLNVPHKLQNYITFITLPDDNSELTVSNLENLKLNKQISPKELDFLISQIIRDFSDYQLDVLIISFSVLSMLDEQLKELKSYLKKQDIIRGNILIPFLNEDESWSVLFVKDFLSLFKDDFLRSINKEKIIEDMKIYFIYDNNNPENIMKNFKNSVEKLEKFIENYLSIIYEPPNILEILKHNFSYDLDYKFININSLFNSGNIELIQKIFKHEFIIEMLRELSQRFCTIKNLKIDEFIENNKDQLTNGKKLKKTSNKVTVNKHFTRNRSLTPISKLNDNFILTPITNNKGQGKSRNTDTCVNKKKNSNAMKSINVKGSKKFESSLSLKEEMKEMKNDFSPKNKGTKPYVDEYNFEYLNTEESLNQYKDQRFSFKVKKENNNQLIKEEINETNNLQGILPLNKESKDKSNNYKEDLFIRESALKFPSEVKYDFVEDNSHHSLSSDMEEITVNRQLHQSVIDNKPTLEIKKAATFNFTATNLDKKGQFPFQLDDEDLFFNNLDLIDDYVRKAKVRKNKFIKTRISKEKKDLKVAKNENYLFNLKGRLNPSSLLDNHIKNEFGLKNIRKGKNMIRYNTYRILYDSQNDEEKRCLAYADSKCKLF